MRWFRRYSFLGYIWFVATKLVILFFLIFLLRGLLGLGELVFFCDILERYCCCDLLDYNGCL